MGRSRGSRRSRGRLFFSSFDRFLGFLLFSLAINQAYGIIYGMVARQSMLLSYIDNFRMLAFLCLLCVPAIFLFKRVRAKKGAVAMH